VSAMPEIIFQFLIKGYSITESGGAGLCSFNSSLKDTSVGASFCAGRNSAFQFLIKGY